MGHDHQLGLYHLGILLLDSTLNGYEAQVPRWVRVGVRVRVRGRTTKGRDKAGSKLIAPVQISLVELNPLCEAAGTCLFTWHKA